jgi:hypothetical protein
MIFQAEVEKVWCYRGMQESKMCCKENYKQVLE